MLSGKTINCLLVAVVLVGMVTLPIGVIADEWKPSKEFRAVSSRITDLGKITNLSTAKKQKRLEELETLGREIEQRWCQTDVETYARLTLRICGTLGALDIPGPKRNHLAQSFAMRALKKADDMPLNVECRLVRHVQQNTDVEGKPIKGKARARLRRQQATLWLHAWQRVEKTIDKDWNPKDTGVRNVSPPNATGLPSGVAPTAIKDPKLRAEYEAAIEANRKKIMKYSQQVQARKLKKRWMPCAERFIIRAYMEPPMGKAELKELEGLLKRYVADVGKRARILNAVEKKKMPDDLILRNTTQPANPKPTTQPSEAKYGVANGAVTGIAVTKVPKVLKEYTVKKNLKNHVEMVLKIKPKQVAGDPMLLEITLANKGQNVVRHGPLDGSYADFRIKVVDRNGKQVPFTRFGKQRCGKKKPTEFTKFNPRPIKPGESYSAALNLSLLFDLTLPGTYTAKVETEVYSSSLGKEGTEFTLKVTGLEFKVSEPRPVVRVRERVKDTGPKVAPPPKKK